MENFHLNLKRELLRQYLLMIQILFLVLFLIVLVFLLYQISQIAQEQQVFNAVRVGMGPARGDGKIGRDHCDPNGVVEQNPTVALPDGEVHIIDVEPELLRYIGRKVGVADQPAGRFASVVQQIVALHAEHAAEPDLVLPKIKCGRYGDVFHIIGKKIGAHCGKLR